MRAWSGGRVQRNRWFDRFGPGLLRIAHRGDRARYPENSLCAFAACSGRSPLLELDVQLCADGVPVVFHDADLARTTDAIEHAASLGQASLAVADWPWSALARLDCGSWFLAADPFGTLADGRADRDRLARLMPQRIPRLDEVLAWAASVHMALNIELKAEGTVPPARLAAVVIKQVRAANMAAEVVFSSFDLAIVACCRELAPEIARALLVETAPPADLLAHLDRLDACACHPADAVAGPDLIQTLRSQGFHVNVFTVNDPVRQRQLQDWGATGVFTDYP
jgi:glycerophosphoryl diester phosphodiesterase